MDCDAKVTSVDALLHVVRYVAQSPSTIPPDCDAIGSGDTPKGDMNCDGEVSSVDSLHILRHVAQLPSTLLVGCPLVGKRQGVTPSPAAQLPSPPIDCVLIWGHDRRGGVYPLMTIRQLRWTTIVAPILFLGVFIYVAHSLFESLLESWIGFTLILALAAVVVALFSHLVFGIIESLESRVSGQNGSSRP